jgi:hypothetical protein
LARRSNPLDQAQCNFVLLCLAQQRIPFVAGGKPFGLLAKSFDLIAEAINVRGFVQDRILRFSCHPHGTGSSPEGFEPLRDYPPTRLTFSRGARRRRRQAAVRAPLTTLRPLVDAPQKALKDPPLVNFAELSVARSSRNARHLQRSKPSSRAKSTDGAVSSRMPALRRSKADWLGARRFRIVRAALASLKLARSISCRATWRSQTGAALCNLLEYRAFGTP